MTNDEQQIEPKDRHADYRHYIDKLDDIKIENQRLLGRNTLIISGGAFTLSVTLLKEVYTNPLAWTKGWLIASWILFGLCAFLQFLSDYLSSLSIDVQKKNYEDSYPDKLEEFDALPNNYTTWVRFINFITPWLICIGFISMVVFSSFNFLYSKGDQMKNPTTNQSVQDSGKPLPDVKKGVTPPSPPKKPKDNDSPTPKPKSK